MVRLADGWWCGGRGVGERVVKGRIMEEGVGGGSMMFSSV